MCALSLLVFKDIGFKFEEHVCNKCHDLLMIAYSLKDTAILNAKGNTYRCILMGISKNEGLKRLNNSVTHDRGSIVIMMIIQFHLKLDKFYCIKAIN